MASLPDETLDKQLSDSELAILSKYILEWREKAVLFGLDEGDIEDIEEDHKRNSSQKIAMMRKWKDKCGNRATLRELVIIAEQNGFVGSIHRACRKLGYIVQTDREEQENCSSFFILRRCTCALILFIALVFLAAMWNTNNYSLQAISRLVLVNLRRPFSPGVPYPRKDFIGRDEDVKKLLELIDFSNEHVEIICIVGSPGIGKSELAIYVGNEMILKNAVVHYVDMSEFPEQQLKQVLAEKILDVEAVNITFNKLLTWASNRFWYNLIILDNCDECIHSQRKEFQEAIEDVLQFSDSIKFLTTSREPIVFLESYYTHKLKPLSEDSACVLLGKKIPSVLNETQKRQISELTGEIPLALQIIGSLLNVKVSPPTPAEIIAKLENNPIPTLSPPKLSMQLNISISLSYNYLDKKLQKIGIYLAHFPGSFDEEAAVNVLSSISKTATNEYLSDSLRDLVTRSLVEHNHRTSRYHFHRLIKEFFLLYGIPSETKIKFDIAFQKYFGARLCQMAEIFLFSPKTGLTQLDIERHNIRYLMSTLQNQVNQTHPYYETAVGCFISALNCRYLGCLFSPQELITPVRELVTNLRRELTYFWGMFITTRAKTILKHNIADLLIRQDLVIRSFLKIDPRKLTTTHEINAYIDILSNLGSLAKNTTNLARKLFKTTPRELKTPADIQNAYRHFMLLTHHLASLTDVLKGKDHAIQQYKQNVHIVEELQRIIPTSKEYIFFYRSFLQYESDLDENTTKLYHARILKETENSQLQCEVLGCDYYDIGITYYQLNDVEKSIEYLEKVIDGYPALDQVYSLLHLLITYRSLHNESKVSEIEEKLLSMFSLMMNQTSSVAYSRMGVFRVYNGFLHSVSESNKSKAIQEKMIEALLELGKKGDIKDVIYAYSLATDFYDDKEYSRAFKVASYALESLQSRSDLYKQDNIMVSQYIGSCMIMSKSAYYFNNKSEANKLFVSTIDFLLEKNLTNEYYTDFSQLCGFLILVGNFDYVNNCFFQRVHFYVGGFLYLLFSIQFDALVTDSVNPLETELPTELPTELYPSLIQLSKSTSMSNIDRTNLVPYRHEEPYERPHTSFKIKPFLYSQLVKLLDVALNSNPIRILLNIFLIFFKLFVLYYFLKCCCYRISCCCCRCISNVIISVGCYIAVLCFLIIVILEK